LDLTFEENWKHPYSCTVTFDTENIGKDCPAVTEKNMTSTRHLLMSAFGYQLPERLTERKTTAPDGFDVRYLRYKPHGKLAESAATEPWLMTLDQDAVSFLKSFQKEFLPLPWRVIRRYTSGQRLCYDDYNVKKTRFDFPIPPWIDEISMPDQAQRATQQVSDEDGTIFTAS
jgi:hypothetical protein